MSNERKQETEHTNSGWRSGKIYFSRRSERNFYFMLTMIVILWSALVKFGILSY